MDASTLSNYWLKPIPKLVDKGSMCWITSFVMLMIDVCVCVFVFSHPNLQESMHPNMNTNFLSFLLVEHPVSNIGAWSSN